MFIPHITNKFLLDADLDEFYIDADVVERFSNLFSQYSAKFPKYTIDPKTSRLAYNTTQSMQKLPYYFPQEQFDEIINESSLRYSKVIIPCTEYQVEKGAQCVIPPYFYVEDTNSQTFNVNIENITNVIKYLEKLELNTLVCPMINISSNILTNENTLRYVVSMYTSDEFINKIGGYYLIINGLDTSKASVDELKGLMMLVKALSKYGVKVVSINGFGYATLLMGAKGFISGLTTGEHSNVENWSMSPEDSRNIRSRNSDLVYMPEILGYIYRQELQDIPYTCSCDYCNNSIPLTSEANRIHYYYCRKRDIESIFIGDFSENLNNLKEFYFKAKKVALKLIDERKTTRKGDSLVAPISRWLDSLEFADEINGLEQAENLLSSILNEIDNYDSNSN